MESKEILVFEDNEGKKSMRLYGLSDKAFSAVESALAPFGYTFRKPNR